VAYENNKSFDEKRNAESIFSKRVKAGKRRTYFFDVRETRGSDYFITITESKKRFNDDGYDRHKMFIYKEDFNKFLAALTETVEYVKTDLMPDFDFDAFNHEDSEEGAEYTSEKSYVSEPKPNYITETTNNTTNETASIVTAEDDDSGMDAWKI